MEELLKSAVSSAGLCGALLVFHYYKIVPAMESLKEEIRSLKDTLTKSLNISSKTDLLKIASSPLVHPELKEKATALLNEIEGK